MAGGPLTTTAISDGELVNAAPADEDVLDDGAIDADVGDEEQLDAEATALLKELQDSQLEVQRMLDTQRVQAAELGGMKESLVSELHQLQDESWKLQVFAELEMLKRQLAAINNLDADLDAMEARLEGPGEDEVDEEFQRELAAARAGTLDMLNKLGHRVGAIAGPSTSATVDGDGAAVSERDGDTAAPASSSSAGGLGPSAADGEGEEGGEDVEALQDELDAELAAMYKQLQDIKAESAQVAARKAQLEMELMQLLRDGADGITSQLGDLAVGDDDADAEEKVEEGDGQAAAESAGQ